MIYSSRLPFLMTPDTPHKAAKIAIKIARNGQMCIFPHVTSDTLLEALGSLSAPEAPLSIRQEDVGDYTKILAGAHEVFERILAEEDYVPEVDKSRFPRNNIHRPTGKENSRNSWAWKASVVDYKGSKGPLSGKTACLKDNVVLADVPCLQGTDIFRDWIPNTDASVCKRLLEAGAHITGKAVCENMSLFGASVSAATGPLENFHAPGYSAGGSSSGTAILVASGECDLGIGGDQGGSIRIPASQNGIVGLKATSGLVPYTGVVTYETTIDCVGPLTRSVLENAELLKIIAGADGIDDRQLAGCPMPSDVPDYPSEAKKGVKGLRIGILSEGMDGPLADKRVNSLVTKAAEQFTKQGAKVGHVSIPAHHFATDLWLVVARLSAMQNLTGKSCNHRALYMNDYTDKIFPLNQDKLEKMWPSLVASLTNGAHGWNKLDPKLYGKTMNLARKFRDSVDRALSEFDVIITPTVPFLPKKLFPIPDDATPLTKMSLASGVSLNTCPYSLTGHPGLNIPVGRLSPEDDPSVLLPVGMQIVGPWYSESLLYRVGLSWESANDWHSFH